jgi:hypothetical protein
MTDDHKPRHTQCELGAGKRASAILHALDYAIDISEVFPNESPDIRVLGDRLISAVF